MRPSLRLDITPVLVGLLLATGVVACGPGGTTSSAAADAVHVVATTTVLADLVANVGGDKVSVVSLVPKGGEVHTFDPTPSDMTTLAQADLVVMNGLGLDEWIGQMIVDGGATAPVVELAEDLEGVSYLQSGEEHAAEGSPATEARPADGGHDAHGVNPHLWLNVAYASLYVDRIAEALAEVDPDDAATYRANAAAYQAELATVDGEIRAQIAAIPGSDRRIVSFHEAFPYFAAAYGLEIVGTIVDSPGQDPSAGELARLVEAIKQSGARAVITEAQFSPELAETVASEAGVRVVRDFYNDSLGDAPVDTYVAMMRWNAAKTVEALQ